MCLVLLRIWIRRRPKFRFVSYNVLCILFPASFNSIQQQCHRNRIDFAFCLFHLSPVRSHAPHSYFSEKGQGSLNDERHCSVYCFNTYCSSALATYRKTHSPSFNAVFTTVLPTIIILQTGNNIPSALGATLYQQVGANIRRTTFFTSGHTSTEAKTSR